MLSPKLSIGMAVLISITCQPAGGLNHGILTILPLTFGDVKATCRLPGGEKVADSLRCSSSLRADFLTQESALAFGHTNPAVNHAPWSIPAAIIWIPGTSAKEKGEGIPVKLLC